MNKEIEQIELARSIIKWAQENKNNVDMMEFISDLCSSFTKIFSSGEGWNYWDELFLIFDKWSYDVYSNKQPSDENLADAQRIYDKLTVIIENQSKSMKLQVNASSGKEDFSVPKEFEEYSNSFFKKDSITEREFVDFCLLATQIIDKNWDKRQGIAYSVAGAWVRYANIEEDDLLDQIGTIFGTLELPDHQVAGSEEEVRDQWQAVEELVKEADKKFPKHLIS